MDFIKLEDATLPDFLGIHDEYIVQSYPTRDYLILLTPIHLYTIHFETRARYTWKLRRPLREPHCLDRFIYVSDKDHIYIHEGVFDSKLNLIKEITASQIENHGSRYNFVIVKNYIYEFTGGNVCIKDHNFNKLANFRLGSSCVIPQVLEKGDRIYIGHENLFEINATTLKIKEWYDLGYVYFNNEGNKFAIRRGDRIDIYAINDKIEHLKKITGLILPGNDLMWHPSDNYLFTIIRPSHDHQINHCVDVSTCRVYEMKTKINAYGHCINWLNHNTFRAITHARGVPGLKHLKHDTRICKFQFELPAPEIPRPLVRPILRDERLAPPPSPMSEGLHGMLIVKSDPILNDLILDLHKLNDRQKREMVALFRIKMLDFMAKPAPVVPNDEIEKETAGVIWGGPPPKP